MTTAFGSSAVAACAAELVSGGSLEMSPGHVADAAATAALLPTGTPVYVNHLPGRAGVFADWARLLVPGGRVLVTDPVTITGLVASEELQLRSSIGYFDFAPPGEDQRLLHEAGLDVISVDDLTVALASSHFVTGAQRSLSARIGRSK